MTVSFAVSKSEMDTIFRIVDRAEKLARTLRTRFDRQTLAMDISAAHANGTPLKLEALLAADDQNFAHDVFDIRRHIDRKTGKLGDCFMPRFACRVADDHGKESDNA